ncbi:hypothetical protein J6I39_02515 [bacterium]|nr:hypothetical protein [bacterium]
MVYVLKCSPVFKKPLSVQNLTCMKSRICAQSVHDRAAIGQRLELAAKAKQELEQENIIRENSIKECAAIKAYFNLK